MLDIEWLEPAGIDELLRMAAYFGEAARLVAGGTWVTLVMRQGLLMPQALISLRRVPGLRHIQVDGTGALHVGALVTHRQVERSPVVRAGWPVLAETFATVANVRIRN
ncbi:MAG TPA: 4-hydroxybenzoyl-CoA reductase, partial [Chloroflexi bacterium]|nr:4-hydroxybenzoyl-CoA reductase [Chloroflexota bacterium]